MTVLVWAAVLLVPERLFYVWVSRAPDRFRAFCDGPLGAVVHEPVSAVRVLFYAFKVLQLAVFLWWCAAFAGGLRPEPVPDAAAVGAILIAIGQALNISVFYRLGDTGVFYGGQLGHTVTW